MMGRTTERQMSMSPEVGTPSKGRRTVFRVVAVIMAVSAVAFGLFTAVFGIISDAQRIHAFHNVVVASLLLILSAPPAIAAARAPERAAPHVAHLVALGLAALATMALALKFDVFTLPFVAAIAVLAPLRVPREPTLGPGRPSPVLAVLVAAAAIPLVAYALRQAELQRLDTTSQHAEFNHWVETSFYAVAILLLGVLVALRPARLRPSAWTAGLALAVLGGASLLLPSYASALDSPWAWAALAGGVVFVAAAEWETRRTGDREDTLPS